MKRLLTMALAVMLAVTAIPGTPVEASGENSFEPKMYEIADSSREYAATYTLETMPKIYGVGDEGWWNQFSDRFFYNNMSSSEKAFYDGLSSVCRNFLMTNEDASEMETQNGGVRRVVNALRGVNYSGLTSTQAYEIYIIFSNANPQFYFLSAGGAYSGTSFYPIIYPDYARGDRRASYSTTFRSIIESWIADVNSNSSVLDREKRIYGLLAEKLIYADNTAVWDDHQSTATAVFTGYTVCAGYAECFAMLAKAAGIQTLVVTSDKHEWVQVKLGNYWYNADITFDDGGSSPRWRYFNKSDASIKTDGNHTIESYYSKYGRPACPYDYGNEPKDVQKEEPAITVSSAMYRLFNKNTGEHFYTGSIQEKQALMRGGWADEGVAWYGATDKTTPVYRLFNKYNGEHFYTTNAKEKDILAAGAVWDYEGIGWYSAPSTGKKVYRLFNTKATTMTHHYTANEGEVKILTRGDWVLEGVGWYGN